MSSLTDACQESKQELLPLYRSRCEAEMDLRAIKTVMQMDGLRRKCPAIMQKEIAAHLLAYNLVRSVMVKSGVSGWSVTMPVKLQSRTTIAQGL